ncbi:membrane hypothetical protein [Candidatus Sulfopaludibacter sp. SbA3]|nr:membrane hypothetical protein [Candidatus Sulfopaludibacter sp. SbA3]
MSRSATRTWTIFEPLAIFLMVEYYIWALRWTHKLFWLPSHFARGERPKALGFRSENLRQGLDEFAPLISFLALAGLACGLLLQTTRPIAFEQGLLALAAYVPWGIFQQYMLNGYFLTRFDAVLSRRTAPVLSAALFAGAHSPNWFLMAITLVGGYAATHLYRRYRNLYFLGVAHAILGFLLYLVIPDSISHHLNVGPGR